jgi:hypothetical protein
MLKIEFQKIKVAYVLIKDIKGYHFYVWMFSNSSIEKNCF